MMMPSAPYLRHVLTLYLKMSLNVPRGFINSNRNKIEIATHGDSSTSLQNVGAFIRNNVDGDFSSTARGVKNYYRVMK